MAVPPSPDLPVVCASPEFVAFVERVKREFQVSVTPNLKPPAPIHSTNGSSTSLDHSSTSQPSPQTAQIQSQGEYSFKFRCQRSNSDFLLAAREMLEQFLLNHNVRVYPSPTAHTHKRGDSFAEAFPHFDSKVLSTARRHGEFTPFHVPSIRNSHIKMVLRELETHLISAESVELTRSSEILGDRRLRLANSSPDVKALFNAPAYIYDLEEHEDSQSAYGPPGTGLDYWTPLPPIVSFYLAAIRSSLPHRVNIGLRNHSPNPEYRGCSETGLRFPPRVQDQGTDFQTSISSKSRTVT